MEENLDYSKKSCRCFWCKKSFKPHVRLKSRQKTCGKLNCQKKYKAHYRKNYRKLNYSDELEYRKKRKDNLPPNFWKEWRAKHPEYVSRNCKATQIRMRLRRCGLQRQCDLVQVMNKTDCFNKVFEFARSHRSLIKTDLGKRASDKEEGGLDVTTRKTS